jgi:hypothetical protein
MTVRELSNSSHHIRIRELTFDRARWSERSTYSQRQDGMRLTSKIRHRLASNRRYRT